MDVDQATARKDLFELIARELVITCTAANNDRLDIKIVQRVGHAMEQHAVIRDDLFGFVVHAIAALRVPTAQIAWG